MTPEEFAEMKRLCNLIAEEKDVTKFIKLAEQLNALLERKGIRLVRSSKKQGEGK